MEAGAVEATTNAEGGPSGRLCVACIGVFTARNSPIQVLYTGLHTTILVLYHILLTYSAHLPHDHSSADLKKRLFKRIRPGPEIVSASLGGHPARDVAWTKPGGWNPFAEPPKSTFHAPEIARCSG